MLLMVKVAKVMRPIFTKSLAIRMVASNFSGFERKSKSVLCDLFSSSNSLISFGDNEKNEVSEADKNAEEYTKAKQIRIYKI